MTDRELLELAAKAAGIELWWGHNCQLETPLHEFGGCRWNPLEEPADALTLAVKLGMTIEFIQNYASAFDYDGKILMREPRYPDPLAATCRAITRAAAEIGRTM